MRSRTFCLLGLLALWSCQPDATRLFVNLEENLPADAQSTVVSFEGPREESSIYAWNLSDPDRAFARALSDPDVDYVIRQVVYDRPLDVIGLERGLVQNPAEGDTAALPEDFLLARSWLIRDKEISDWRSADLLEGGLAAVRRALPCPRVSVRILPAGGTDGLLWIVATSSKSVVYGGQRNAWTLDLETERETLFFDFGFRMSGGTRTPDGSLWLGSPRGLFHLSPEGQLADLGVGSGSSSWWRFGYSWSEQTREVIAINRAGYLIRHDAIAAQTSVLHHFTETIESTAAFGDVLRLDDGDYLVGMLTLPDLIHVENGQMSRQSSPGADGISAMTRLDDGHIVFAANFPSEIIVDDEMGYRTLDARGELVQFMVAAGTLSFAFRDPGTVSGYRPAATTTSACAQAWDGVPDSPRDFAITKMDDHGRPTEVVTVHSGNGVVAISSLQWP